MIQKELDQSNGVYEGAAVQKTHSDRYDNERTPEFVGETRAMTDNNPPIWSIRYINKDMRMSEFLMR